MKIRSVGVLSVGKLFGALYFCLGLLFGALFAVISIVGAAVAAKQQGVAGGLPPVAAGIAALVFAPIFYGGMGFIGGVITAALYNLVADTVGGIEIELGQ